MPATDIVNGKARVVIPADTLTDPNGYRLRVTGTLEGEPALLAMGQVAPITGAGPEAVPQDVIDQIDLALQRNSDVVLNVRLWTDESKDVPFDMTVTTILANVYASHGGPVLEPFTVAPISQRPARHLLVGAAGGSGGGYHDLVRRHRDGERRHHADAADHHGELGLPVASHQ
jgi:hypothetical protein